MLNLRARIANPWHNEDRHPWRDLYQGAWQISKNKSFELGVFFYTHDLFELDISTDWRGYDHAGPRFSITILGLEISLSIHDHRHWDYESGCWELHV